MNTTLATFHTTPGNIAGIDEEFAHPVRIGLVDKIVLWPICVLIIVESVFFLTAFARNTVLRKASNIIAASLVFGDLLNGGFFLPCVLLLGLDHPVINTTMMLVLISSFGNVFSCAFDRFVAVRYALNYRKIMTKSVCVKILVVVWFTAIVLAIIPKCMGSEYEYSFAFRRVYLAIILSFLLLLTLIIFLAYGYIFRTVLAHIRKINSLIIPTAQCRKKSLLQKLRDDLRHTRIFALTTVNFIACWFPLIYINFVADVLLFPEYAPIVLLRISLHTIFLSSLVNPIVYCYCKTDIRDCLYKMIKSDCFYFNSDMKLKKAEQTQCTGGGGINDMTSNDEMWRELFKEQCLNQAKIMLFDF